MKDYLHEIPKETLTYQIVRKELKKSLLHDIAPMLIFTALSILFLILAMNFEYDVEPILFYFIWFCAIVFCVAAIAIIIYYIKLFVQFNQKTTIVTDWLVDIKDSVELHAGYNHRRARPYYEFTFAKYGKYRLYTDVHGNTNYTWSKMYAMSNEGVYNYSNIDDNFYLVVTNDKKPQILLIYNQKLFEME